MRVVFGFDASYDRVVQVYWEGDQGEVMVRTRKQDGSSFDRSLGCCGLQKVMMEYSSPYSPLYPAEIDDVRSAFKYLGKAADLAETLPEADLGDSQTNSQAS